MPDSSPVKKTTSSASPKSIRRAPIAVFVGLQLLAILTIFIAVNYLSFRHYQRVDLTQSQKFTLSSLTTSFLSGLSTEIDVIVAFTPSSEIYNDIRSLAEEYQRLGNKSIRVEVLDPARYPDRSAELKAKYGVTLDRNLVIVSQGDRTRVISESDIAIRDGNGMIAKLSGEIALTSALIEVVEGRRRKIYVLNGFQRQDYLQEVVAEITTLANRQNAVVDFLSLSGGAKVPDDADTLVIAAPQSDPSPAEMKSLTDFWNSERGSIFLALDPEAPTPALLAFVRRLGASPRDDRVLFASRVPGQPLQTTFSVPALVRAGSPISTELAGMEIPLGGRSQSLELFPTAEFVKNENIHLTPLLVADARFWGETGYAKDDIARDKDADNHSPLYLGATIERGAVDDPNLRVETQRMVLVTNPTILSGGDQRQKIRSDFTMASLNWLLDRTELTGVLPKEPTRYAVVVSEARKRLINLIVIWLLPGLALLLGLFVWLGRRN